MRPGEACHLIVSDIDLANGVVQVLETKFGKSRLVFIHPTTAAVVGHYLRVRQDWVGAAARACPAVFVNSRREAINPDSLGATFRQIAAAAGITTGPGHRPPRLHDLRHTFAVTTMLDWYRGGRDVQERLPLLSTWLGHADPASTYWYLHAVPELLAHAARRLDARAGAPATGPAS
jgi:integrase